MEFPWLKEFGSNGSVTHMVPVSAPHPQAALALFGGAFEVTIADDVLEGEDADPIDGAPPLVPLELIRMVEVVPRAP